MIEGETRVLTQQSKAIKVKDCVGKYGVFDGSIWINVEFYPVPYKSAYRLNFRDGSELICSGSLFWDAYKPSLKQWKRYDTSELVKSTSVRRHKQILSRGIGTKNAFLKGCVARVGLANYDGRITFPETSGLAGFLKAYKYRLKDLEEILPYLIDWADKEHLPEEVFSWELYYINQFLAGFLASSGTHFNRILQLRREVSFLKDLQLLMKLAGFNPTVTESERKLITKISDLPRLKAIFGDYPRIHIEGTYEEQIREWQHVIDSIEFMEGDFTMYAASKITKVALSNGYIVGF